MSKSMAPRVESTLAFTVVGVRIVAYMDMIISKSHVLWMRTPSVIKHGRVTLQTGPG